MKEMKRFFVFFTKLFKWKHQMLTRQICLRVGSESISEHGRIAPKEEQHVVSTLLLIHG